MRTRQLQSCALPAELSGDLISAFVFLKEIFETTRKSMLCYTLQWVVRAVFALQVRTTRDLKITSSMRTRQLQSCALPAELSGDLIGCFAHLLEGYFYKKSVFQCCDSKWTPLGRSYINLYVCRSGEILVDTGVSR
jgi:hypothetical protein